MTTTAIPLEVFIDPTQTELEAETNIRLLERGKAAGLVRRPPVLLKTGRVGPEKSAYSPGPRYLGREEHTVIVG